MHRHYCWQSLFDKKGHCMHIQLIVKQMRKPWALVCSIMSLQINQNASTIVEIEVRAQFVVTKFTNDIITFDSIAVASTEQKKRVRKWKKKRIKEKHRTQETYIVYAIKLLLKIYFNEISGWNVTIRHAHHRNKQPLIFFSSSSSSPLQRSRKHSHSFTCACITGYLTFKHMYITYVWILYFILFECPKGKEWNQWSFNYCQSGTIIKNSLSINSTINLLSFRFSNHPIVCLYNFKANALHLTMSIENYIILLDYLISKTA